MTKHDYKPVAKKRDYKDMKKNAITAVGFLLRLALFTGLVLIASIDLDKILG